MVAGFVKLLVEYIFLGIVKRYSLLSLKVTDVPSEHEHAMYRCHLGVTMNPIVTSSYVNLVPAK